MSTCLNCGNQLHGNFCADCGQSSGARRLDVHWLIDCLSDIVLHLKRNKVVRTITMMIKDPGRVVLDYIEGRRVDYHPPLSYLLLSALIYTVLADQVFKPNGWEAGRFAGFKTSELLASFGIISCVGYVTLSKPKYNIFETVVIICFLYGTVFLIAPIIGMAIQAPFPKMSQLLPLHFRPFIVDAWSILLSLYIGVRVALRLGVSLAKLLAVVAFTLALYAASDFMNGLLYPKSY